MEAYFRQEGVSLYHGDCLNVLKTFEADSLDAMVTVPLAPTGRRETFIDSLATVAGACLRVLKPGAHGLVRAIPRTAHWTAWAMEDAGFQVRDRITNLVPGGSILEAFLASLSPEQRERLGQAMGQAAQGWLAGGLAPTVEDWWLVRKPGPLRPLGIEGCRIGTETICTSGGIPGKRLFGSAIPDRTGSHKWNGQSPSLHTGRWPANLCLSHVGGPGGCRRAGLRRVRSHNPDNAVLVGDSTTPNAYGQYGKRSAVGHADAEGLETVEAWECVEGCPVRLLDGQSGERPGATNKSPILAEGDGGRIAGGKGYKPMLRDVAYRDTGGASRFFYCASFSRMGPDNDRGDLMRWLCRLVTPPGGTVLDPFAATGDTAQAAIAEGFGFVGIEQDLNHVDLRITEHEN
jgi:site-specific DNA-methyltransferase (adenine-specific)